MAQETIEIQVLGSLGQVDPSAWDACARAGDGRAPDPFTTYRFLSALENSGSVGPGTGWQPQYLLAKRGDTLIACAPLYAKSHSQGEYVFDHSWAHAYERAGGRYYPKLQLAVPFTPVTGPRFLTLPGAELAGMSALIQGAVQLASEHQVSSLHVTFCTQAESLAGQQMGLLHRTGQQFHWLNDGYTDFDGFLAALSSRKRKTIRKERRVAQGFGGSIRQLTGDDIKAHHWDAFWQFYQDTGARKWGSPYLTRAFFEIAHDTMRDDTLLVLAEQDGVPIAGALNFIGQDTLFGRYWGCIQDYPCLHFEACYYQAIDYAIAQGLQKVEAGAQGDHKLARGYLPVETHSLHWIADAGFARAVEQFLQGERQAVAQEIDILTDYGPFKRAQTEDHQ
ncbi:GNAT family N-acetyltransferase [Thalassobius sp. S69A]|uniref:GNAT family N-acetyltransferase n=1 Tax=unclassified Thalassovita TaxID=2619711 RepID=UPI000C5338D9|nr:GNAT family N-acetyltransferase [Paracoccaceae bacterium]